MSVLNEAAKMVVGMVEYYSDKKINLNDVIEALRPLVESVQKDSEGYLKIVEDNEKERKAQGVI